MKKYILFIVILLISNTSVFSNYWNKNILNRISPDFADSLVELYAEGSLNYEDYNKLGGYFLYCNVDSARFFIDLALKSVPQGQIQGTYELLSFYYLNVGLKDSALLVMNNIINTKPDEFSIERGYVYLLRGYIQYDTWNTKQAFNDYFNALNIFEKKSDSLGICRAYILLGQTFHIWRNYNRSIDFLNKALEMLKYFRSKQTEFEVNLWKAVILMRAGKIECKDYFFKSKEIVKGIKSPLLRIQFNRYIGMYYLDIERNIDSALSYFEKTKQMAIDEGYLTIEADIYTMIGRCHFILKQVDKELKANLCALHLRKAIGINKSTSSSFLNVGDIYYKTNKFNLAKKYYQNGLDYAQLSGMKYYIQKGFLGLSQVNETMGDSKKALKYYKEYSKIKDSLRNEAGDSKIMQRQIEYEIERKDVEAENLRKDLTLNKLELNKKELELNQGRLYLIILLVSAVLLTLLALLLFNRFRLKKKSNEKLEATNNKLHESEKKLKHLNNMKDKFFSITAHDIKNPLNNFILAFDLMTKNIDNYTKEKRDSLFNDLKKSSNNLFNLLDNLLIWSKVQMKNITPSFEKTNISALLKTTIDLLNLDIKHKNIKINLNLMETNVYADPDMVFLIFRNLIHNSIKYSFQDSGIDINSVQCDDFIEISIRDYGAGISEKLKENLFQIGVGFSQPGAANEKGSGLGLIICEEFVELNNGTLWIDSKEGEGTTATLLLPKYSGV